MSSYAQNMPPPHSHLLSSVFVCDKDHAESYLNLYACACVSAQCSLCAEPWEKQGLQTQMPHTHPTQDTSSHGQVSSDLYMCSKFL